MDEYYGVSIDEVKILNRFTYRGKGRPRKRDYVTFSELQRILNREMDKYMSVPPKLLK